ncbi:MAG TPA: aldehyde ferredoxin oxidoreductase family protein [Firmicutes bacterium]|nr:aldehyde ferredoxin oxidoreductase family protein [Bacillota bacterium]
MSNWDSIVLLTVNLSNGVVNKTTLTDKSFLKKYLGGRGVATHYFLSKVDPFVDPYSPDNPIIFAPGTLTGTFVPCSGRTSIMFKSPATNRFFKTNVGGAFGAQLKFAGYDILIVEGKAEEPVYIYIENERVEIRSAKHLWGKDMRETNQIVREENDDDELQLACIGPAGENKVIYASVHASIYNAAGRGGGGAVMGDKNLKAIAVKGTKSIGVSRPKEFAATVKRLREKMEEASGVQPLSDYGTSVGVESTNSIGAFPVKNFQQSTIYNVHLLTGQYLVESGLLKRKVSCYSCPVACHRFVTVDDGKYRGTYCGGPEYETLSALGGGCLSTDINAVIKANELCNILGLDVISTGNCIQWLLECKQRGVMTDADADGLDLSWGNMDTVIELTRKIAHREGVGDLLAKGLKVAAEEVGQDSYKWAIQARGLEQSRVETRSAFAYALAFAVSSRGPDHLNTECLAEFGGAPEAIQLIERITGSKEYAYPYTTDKRAEIVRWHEDIYAAGDSMGICAFPTTAQHWVDEFDMADLYSSFSGIDVTAEEIMMSGRRVITLERVFSGILGYTRADDVLPYRMMYEKQLDAMHDNAINSPEVLDIMKDQYFKLHGWDLEAGLPTKEVLEELELDEFESKATFL